MNSDIAAILRLLRETGEYLSGGRLSRELGSDPQRNLEKDRNASPAWLPH